MRLSSLADYAVVMMSAAARHCGGVARLNATLLSEETGVPLPTAQKLVSRLSAAGLLESARGTGGGFRLSRPPSSISLADIIEAVEGPIALTACVDGATQDCCIDQTCKVKPHWNIVNGAVRGALANVSLASLSTHPGEGRGPDGARDLAEPGTPLLQPSHLDPGLRRGTRETV
ncbi:SUF system Fe-S cluster assembly regulator [Sphingomonas ginsenosidivorax]|uniref:SUF system Fe-S cluster assembly regulator n=1 Tax=Sphingomonas ginsenosidivorax TaxID=862135 RepID=A0A5C6UP52_9SPHN|nr:SUF system Fe-S cluster assembly regulator [Sphingomonas ginsenosidivorax]TXC72905.1 SUF system Fe-S cluster assembly regulator [Sphingomonas ginsenosidivorax]